ncbi:IucA/IucC family siderophore biosynthesis protein [Paenibacillus sp. N4]|uniref:IucA/IucC family protein n=1 Tax=Paenibacillus vietnamensis TaxID=2590547 RepID=UPI001CD0B2AA|nr:IucA/IucC family protein [Paenibacillus vietnamensis]MCA0757535.1 IucA/IucC family siderophore biosynthesis protein [Paenibacillus vietnamensis]
MIREQTLEHTETVIEKGGASHTVAARATLQSLLNAFLRETGLGEWHATEAGWELHVPLAGQAGTLLVSVKHKSATGRHLFHFPMHWNGGEGRGAAIGSEESIAEKLVLELGRLVKDGTPERTEELLLRIKESRSRIEQFVAARQADREQLYGFDGDFLSAEQSLLFGHLLHPTPKSREGVPEHLQSVYSPELKGQFQLHYFRAHRSIVLEDSSLDGITATEWIKSELRHAAQAEPHLASEYTEADNYTLIPLHPLQAAEVLAKPQVQKLLEAGLLQDLGPMGREFAATSSFRTVYHSESPWMAKGSVPVRITNSLRVNKHKELERGVEVSRLLKTSIGEVSTRYPAFAIVQDPAFVSVALEGEEESGFEVVLRANPFQGEKANQASLVASLVQDPIPGSESRLGTIVRILAEREGRTTEAVSLDWFRRYLDMSLKPMVWLYLTHGIALEAHQQNSVVQLSGGYPERYYYRDNQGYYFCNSLLEHLNAELPGIGVKSQTFCDDSIADERFRYYLIFNHMFGLINGFGTAGLADERLLLQELRSALESFLPLNREPSVFLESLLTEEKLPCKANLLTRLYDLDELVGSLENQSVYVTVDNPLVVEVQEHAGRHDS